MTALQSEMFEVLPGFAASELPHLVRAAVRDVARELAIGNAQDVLCNAVEAARILGTHAARLEACPRTWQGASRPHGKHDRQARRIVVAEEGSSGLRRSRRETRSGLSEGSSFTTHRA